MLFRAAADQDRQQFRVGQGFSPFIAQPFPWPVLFAHLFNFKI